MTGEHHEVEDVVDEVRLRGTVVLERVERRLPVSSSATISPSTAVSSGRDDTALAIDGYRTAKSLSLRERSETYPPVLKLMAR
jgi:hypothetical protein